MEEEATDRLANDRRILADTLTQFADMRLTRVRGQIGAMLWARSGDVADWTPEQCNQALNQLWEMLKHALWFNELKAPALRQYLLEWDARWAETKLEGTFQPYRETVRDWAADPKNLFPAIPRWKEDLAENPCLLDWSMHWSAICGATGDSFRWDDDRKVDKRRRRVISGGILMVCHWDESRYDKARTGVQSRK